MLNPINTYTGGGLVPAIDSADAKTDSIVLAASRAFGMGQVLGFVPGTGTAVAEVQTITGTAVTGGTWRIQFDGYLTAALAATATAAQIQAALEALTNVGTGGVTVSGGPITTTPVVLTFAGELAGQAQPLVAVISSLVGTAAVSRTTNGRPAGGYWDAYDATQIAPFAGLATARRLLKYDGRTDAKGRIYPGTDQLGGDSQTFQRSVAAYYAGTFRCGDLVGLDAAAVASLGRIIAGDPSALTSTSTILRIG